MEKENLLGHFNLTQIPFAGGFKKEYKMTVTVGPNFYWGLGAIQFSDLVKEKTNGRINIKPYFGSTLQGSTVKIAPDGGKRCDRLRI
jgi:TRAP-type C4-dicarboxylate transport system substrate-binding protein